MIFRGEAHLLQHSPAHVNKAVPFESPRTVAESTTGPTPLVATGTPLPLHGMPPKKNLGIVTIPHPVHHYRQSWGVRQHSGPNQFLQNLGLLV